MKESFIATSYDAYHWSSRKMNSIAKTNINIKGADGAKCVIWFETNDAADLQQAQRYGPKTYAFYYYQWQYKDILDLLRNEKPITIEFNDDNGPNSRITTGYEPIGEGDGIIAS